MRVSIHDLAVNNALCINSDRCLVMVWHTNMFPAGVAVLSVEGLKAGAAVRTTLLHDVALPPQHCLTLETAEVLHVPVTALRLSALICKDDLRKEEYRIYCQSSEVKHQLGY